MGCEHAKSWPTQMDVTNEAGVGGRLFKVRSESWRVLMTSMGFPAFASFSVATSIGSAECSRAEEAEPARRLSLRFILTASLAELSKVRALILWPRKERLQARLHATQARKVRSYITSSPSSNCSMVMVQVAGSLSPRGHPELSQVSDSARARMYASSSGVSFTASSKPGGGEPLPTFRKRTGEEDRERRGAVTKGARGGVPGVNRRDRQEQHMKAALQPAQG